MYYKVTLHPAWVPVSFEEAISTGLIRPETTKIAADELWVPCTFRRANIVASNYLRVVKINVRSGKPGKVRKWTTNGGGYLTIRFMKPNLAVGQHHLGHFLAKKRTVVEDFPEINHLNGIKTDNRPENLEECDGSENMRHAYRTGLSPTTAVVGWCEDRVCFYNAMNSAERDGFDHGAISRCISGQCKTHHGLSWRKATEFEKQMKRPILVEEAKQ